MMVVIMMMMMMILVHWMEDELSRPTSFLAYINIYITATREKR